MSHQNKVLPVSSTQEQNYAYFRSMSDSDLLARFREADRIWWSFILGEYQFDMGAISFWENTRDICETILKERNSPNFMEVNG